MSTPYNSQQVKTILAERGAQVEAYLQHCLDAIPMQGRLKEAMYYSLLAGGKRLRPVLCLSTAALFGLSAEAVMPFAASLEMIHTYSLIHDDLPAMDDDDLRRGRPSCHKAFDEATAILAGDALLTDAFGFMASTVKDLPAGRVLEALASVSAAAGSAGMVGGQILDMDCTGKTDVPLETLQTLHALKTGAMFRVACVSGGLLAGASESDIASLRAYGEALGVTFQIVDDILDETADTAKRCRNGQDHISFTHGAQPQPRIGAGVRRESRRQPERLLRTGRRIPQGARAHVGDAQQIKPLKKRWSEASPVPHRGAPLPARSVCQFDKAELYREFRIPQSRRPSPKPRQPAQTTGTHSS